MIHAGHNHLTCEAPISGIITATETMICTLRSINPRVAVLVAQVIPGGKLPKYEYIPALNVELDKLAARLNTTSQPVICVNMAEGFDWRTDTIEDRAHPNARGGCCAFECHGATKQNDFPKNYATAAAERFLTSDGEVILGGRKF